MVRRTVKPSPSTSAKKPWIRTPDDPIFENVPGTLLYGERGVVMISNTDFDFSDSKIKACLIGSHYTKNQDEDYYFQHDSFDQNDFVWLEKRGKLAARKILRSLPLDLMGTYIVEKGGDYWRDALDNERITRTATYDEAMGFIKQFPVLATWTIIPANPHHEAEQWWERL